LGIKHLGFSGGWGDIFRSIQEERASANERAYQGDINGNYPTIFPPGDVHNQGGAKVRPAMREKAGATSPFY